MAEERADLQAKKETLVLEGAENNRKLKEIEDQILQILDGKGNILEDESGEFERLSHLPCLLTYQWLVAINTLNQSKVVSDDIKAKMKISDQTEKEIDDARAAYKPAAFATQVLFFCISALCNIEPTYSQTSRAFAISRLSVDNPPLRLQPSVVHCLIQEIHRILGQGH